MTTLSGELLTIAY